uniref:Uncharacterized protein n=1 Tax=Arundo donax TaxID=35708 RepID=A0A0A9E757_ARUDO
MAAKVKGFRTIQCPRGMAQNKWVLHYMYKSNRKGASVAAGNGNFSTTPSFPKRGSVD